MPQPRRRAQRIRTLRSPRPQAPTRPAPATERGEAKLVDGNGFFFQVWNLKARALVRIRSAHHGTRHAPNQGGPLELDLEGTGLVQQPEPASGLHGLASVALPVAAATESMSSPKSLWRIQPGKMCSGRVSSEQIHAPSLSMPHCSAVSPRVTDWLPFALSFAPQQLRA